MTTRLLRTGALIVAAQLMIALIGVLALRLYTDLVTPAVFGGANLLLSALGLGLQLFVSGFVAAQLRFYSEAQIHGGADTFTRQTMVWALRAAAVLVGLALLVLLAMRLLGVLPYGAVVMASGAAWLFAMTVRNVLLSRIQAQRRQATYAMLQITEALLLLGVTFAALSRVPSVASFLIGQAAAIAAFLPVVVAADPGVRGIFRVHAAPGAGFGSRAWAYGAPFAPMSFLSWLANLGDRYTLAAMLGSDAAGRYVAPFSIASRGMMLANTALCDLFRPILFDAENRGDHPHANETFANWVMASVALSAAGLAVVYFGGSLIARWLLAPGYRSGALGIMVWVALGYAVSGITQIVENRLLSLGHSGRLLLPMILGAATNLAFSIVLVRMHGIVGAAQATCASFVCQNLTTIGFLTYALRGRSAHGTQETKVEPA